MDGLFPFWGNLMEKETLVQFEQRCIQEEPPFCTAACPFHVDVKSFLQHMAGQSFDNAFKVLEKTLPLPEVLSRICDHPCQVECIRKSVDDPLAVGSLERACAALRSRQKKYFKAPAKGKAVGIWGSGASSLVAAWDLSLKGYAVSVFEKESCLGGLLNRIDPLVLPRAVFEKEMDRLKGFGASFFPGTDFSAFKKLTADSLALFIGLDAHGGPDPSSVPEDVDSFSLRQGESRYFYGGFSHDGLHADGVQSPVMLAFQGRKAATSIDRILSGVSLEAGRQKEGVFTTRLDTDLSRITPMPGTGFEKAMAGRSTASTPDPDLAAAEAARCHQCDCSRCIRACNSFIESFGGFPGRYAREIYNNLSIVMGERKANLMINSCTLCDLCTTVCPNDFSMAELCLQARQQMLKDKRMPVSAHAFALEEMAHAMGEECFFAGHAQGVDHSDVLFFPGCQLVGSAPVQAARAWHFLKGVNKATGIVTGCCGAPAFWAGRTDLFEAAARTFKKRWEDFGCPEVVTACTACTRMLEKAVPKERIKSLYRVMADAGAEPEKKWDHLTVAVADPCTSRDDMDTMEAVRTLAARAGAGISELAASGELTECCGFGGLTFNANPKLAQTIIKQRAGQADTDYLAYCAMCRDRLAGAGKHTFHILDLFFPEDLPDPGARPDPGFSRRRMNRVLFKAGLGADPLWEPSRDPAAELAAPSGKKVVVPPDVIEGIEDQFILLSDIVRVLDYFETQSPSFFTHGERGSNIVSFRPGPVCFWVEFATTDDGYRVLDAWAHRMSVVASALFVEGKSSEDHDPQVRCGKCGTPLAFYKNNVEYLGSRFDVDLPQCPDCGTVFISARLCRTRMAEVEHILEDK